MKSYHFDVGNSTDGPIGYCARVWASSKQEALEILRKHLCEESVLISNEVDEDGKGIEYLAVYVNAQAVSVKDIDEWEYVEEA
jgi:hypothetical protein